MRKYKVEFIVVDSGKDKDEELEDLSLREIEGEVVNYDLLFGLDIEEESVKIKEIK